MKNGWNAVRKRLGPVGLSLAAAAITAAGFAAFSVAADDDKDGPPGEPAYGVAGPAPGGPGIMFHAEDLSKEDQQKLENFRQCMEDQGVPAPPDVRQGEGPPEPPSQKEFEQMHKKVEQAHEACKDELPEDLQDLGPPPFGPGPCGPPPPGRDRQDGDGRNDDGQNREQSFELPAPAPSGTS